MQLEAAYFCMQGWENKGGERGRGNKEGEEGGGELCTFHTSSSVHSAILLCVSHLIIFHHPFHCVHVQVLSLRTSPVNS